MKSGFTLAELLLVLTIIGVVATELIPNLINDFQDANYRVSFRKHYADINQAVRRMTVDNGGTIKGIFSADGDANGLKNAFKII